MPGGGKPAHVTPGLSDDHVGDTHADPWNRGDQVPDAAKGFHHHLDAGRELGHGVGVPVDQIQVQSGQKGVVFGEAAGESLGGRRDLRPQSLLGQLRQRSRVTLAGDQRLEHGPPGHAADI